MQPLRWAFTSVPFPHTPHASCPALDHRFWAQGAQLALALMRYRPAAQRVQLVAPLSGWMDPKGQGSQAPLAPEALEKVPGAQAAQRPPSSNWPVGQGLQPVLVLLATLPTLQLRHASQPLSDHCVSAQGRHTLLLALANRPALHWSHRLLPAA